MSPRVRPNSNVRSTPPVTEAALLRLVPGVLRRLRHPASRVTVAFLDNAVLRRLKHAWLRKNAAFVDVLAFPESRDFPHPEKGPPSLGDIYLNRMFRRRPAECERIFIHGLLHLLGFSHAGKRDTMVMEQRERELCGRLSAARGRGR